MEQTPTEHSYSRAKIERSAWRAQVKPAEHSYSPAFTEHELDLIYDALENYQPSEHVSFTEEEIERVTAKIVPPYSGATRS